MSGDQRTKDSAEGSSRSAGDHHQPQPAPLSRLAKTKVHLHGCVFFGQPDPPAPCTCPLRQAWGSLDALIGRLRAAFEEHGGSTETNPFGNGAIRVYLREVKECQAKARGIPYKKKKKKKAQIRPRDEAKAFDADSLGPLASSDKW
ncbi:hypothetical protein OIU84_014306 [Salix udensis]|uniref:ALOG domain-containing protein n=1 Tax=Salix udensis TaxID=889485 RepID=A0AAD6NRV1_9ROSI|nr:hypothetical protein OIU84_014306 [Salix udensis]